jgi:hypothetical protein
MLAKEVMLRQPNEEVEKLAYRVIGAAIEVHQVLGRFWIFRGGIS